MFTFEKNFILSDFDQDLKERYKYLGRVHPVVHKYTTIFIYICRLNTAFFNDVIGDRFPFKKTILRPCTWGVQVLRSPNLLFI